MAMAAERSAQSYGPAVTAASKAVLLELLTILRRYHEAFVLVGGWVPYFLLAQHRPAGDTFEHVGSIDIDLAIDPARVDPEAYATMVALLTPHGYRPVPSGRAASLPASLERTVASPVTRKPYTIRVDFLTGTAVEGPPRAVPIQESLLARKLKGCDAAFTHATTIALSGVLPEGGQLTVPLRMADVVACLTMKSIVLGERFREKDAYDLYAVIAHYQRGPQDVAAALRPYLTEPLVAEGLRCLREAFASRQAHGPAWAAQFQTSPRFAAEYERRLTEAFLTVEELFRQLAPDGASG
jgi:hypothetical protein